VDSVFNASGDLESQERIAAQLARDEPETLRDHLTKRLLPKWAGAVVGSEPGTAEALMTQLAALARIHAASHGDSVVLASVAELRALSRAAQRSAAEALRYHDLGERLFERGDYDSAGVILGQALRAFHRLPMGQRLSVATWGPTQVLLAASVIYGANYTRGEQLHEQVRREIQSRAFPSLVARTLWGEGIGHGRQGRLHR